MCLCFMDRWTWICFIRMGNTICQRLTRVSEALICMHMEQGVDFPAFIYHNVKGKSPNNDCIGQYEEDVVMMMYDSVVIKKLSEIRVEKLGE